MEVAVPIPSSVKLDIGRMYLSAPSSPKSSAESFDYFYHHASAPTSPTRAIAVYGHLSSANTSPSEWGRRTGDDSVDPFDDFSFDSSGHLETGDLHSTLVDADELFEAGRIRSIKPPLPPSLRAPSSPKTPRFMGFLSPRNRGGKGDGAKAEEVSRDREREGAPSSPSIPTPKNKWESRSLPPLGGEGVFPKSLNSSPSNATSTASCTKSGGSKRWKFKNLLFFRSSSEGRVSGTGSKDPMRKFTVVSSPSSSPLNKISNLKNGSLRWTGKSGSAERGSKGSQIVSAHEIHYRENRAAYEEQKKRTPWPYHRRGLFSYLRFNRAVHCVPRAFNE